MERQGRASHSSSPGPANHNETNFVALLNAHVRNREPEVDQAASSSGAGLDNIDLNAAYEYADQELNNPHPPSANSSRLWMDTIRVGNDGNIEEISPDGVQISNEARNPFEASQEAGNGRGAVQREASRLPENNQRNIRARISEDSLSAGRRWDASQAQPTSFFHYDPVDDDEDILDVAPISVAPPLLQPPAQPPAVYQTRLFAQSLTVPADDHPVNGPETASQSNRAPDTNFSYPGYFISGNPNQQQQPNSHVRLPVVPVWNPRTNRAEYPNQRTDMVNRFGVRRHARYQYEPVLAPSPVVRQMHTEIRGRQNAWPGNMAGPERHAADDFPQPQVPQPQGPQPLVVRSITAAQWREHMISGVNRALHLVRRGQFRIEDVLPGGNRRTSLSDLPEVDADSDEDDEDVYDDDDDDDMRLDLDNMSYEEIVDLEAETGPVRLPITESTILPHLRQRQHQPNEPGYPSPDENCCICQESYLEGENITKLECGHDYHVNCIAQWLVVKNQCPMCKSTGLAALVGHGHREA